ncbi:MAG TPA: hypothetical protein VKE51_42645 [Vicinamibacterales bacterium]|nr:hypothetical protein [Vicinamibacterales bacterium]
MSSRRTTRRQFVPAFGWSSYETDLKKRRTPPGRAQDSTAAYLEHSLLSSEGPIDPPRIPKPTRPMGGGAGI